MAKRAPRPLVPAKAGIQADSQAMLAWVSNTTAAWGPRLRGDERISC
jgi:hypothetical protein